MLKSKPIPPTSTKSTINPHRRSLKATPKRFIKSSLRTFQRKIQTKTSLEHPISQSQQKANQIQQYTQLCISTWPFDSTLPSESSEVLQNDTTIFFRPQFQDQIPPKVHQLGEISFPYHNLSLTIPQHQYDFELLSSILTQAVVHQNYYSQVQIESLKQAKGLPSVLTQPSKQSNKKSTTTNNANPSTIPFYNNQFNKDIIHLYTNHLDYNSQTIEEQLGTLSLSMPLFEKKLPTPLPAYLTQGSYQNLKSLTSVLKQYLTNHYELSPPMLSLLFNVQESKIVHEPHLLTFLNQRHIALLSSYILGRILVGIDSNYTPLHIVDLPTSHQVNNAHNPFHRSAHITTTVDMLANVIEKQAPISIPVAYLPKKSFGQTLPDQTLQSIRATTLQTIKTHHGFTEPAKRHPQNPEKMIKTLAPLPTTLQHSSITNLLPLPLLSSIISSQSSKHFSIPSATKVFCDMYDLKPDHASQSLAAHSQFQNPNSPFSIHQSTSNLPSTRQLHGGFNVFSPTRLDYVTIFQQQFVLWASKWLTSRSRLPQLNILDLGAGTGVFGVTAQDIFHHLSTLQNNYYQEPISNSQLSFDPSSFTLDSPLNHLLKNRRDKPFRLNITSSDINPRSIGIAQKNFDELNITHQLEPGGPSHHEEGFRNTSARSTTNDLSNSIVHDDSDDDDLTIKHNKRSKNSIYSYGVQSNCVQSDLFFNLPHPETTPPFAIDRQMLENPSSLTSPFLPPVISTTPFYDLIIFNPPWLPLPQRSTASSDRAIYDSSFETLTSFLQQSKSHLRSSQPFYQHLYRSVKAPKLSNHNVHSSQQQHNDHDEQYSNNKNINHLANHRNYRVFELTSSEVWVVISDLFQKLHLDDVLTDHLNIYSASEFGAKNNSSGSKKALNTKPGSKNRQFPSSEERFVEYLETMSGLQMVNVIETSSHNFNHSSRLDPTSVSNEGKSLGEIELDLVRSNEKVKIYILRDNK